jgi:hypothetical protein
MPSAYVPPHARKTNANQPSLTTNNKMDTKNKIDPKIVFENNFPQLVNNPKVDERPVMKFNNLFKETDEPPKEKKEELQKGYIKLTKNGIVYSLTDEEKQQEDTMKTNKIMSENMKKFYNTIEKKKQDRMAWDSNYVPEVVIDEYSSSECYSSEETEDFTEDPEEENSEL